MNQIKKIIFSGLFLVICKASYAVNNNEKKHAVLTQAGNTIDLVCDKDHCLVKAENAKNMKISQDISYIDRYTDRDWVNDDVIQFTVHGGTNFNIDYFFNFKTLKFTDAFVDVVAVDPDRNIVVVCAEADSIEARPIFDLKAKPMIIKRNFDGPPSSAIKSYASYFTENGELHIKYVTGNRENHSVKEEFIKIELPGVGGKCKD